MIIVLAADSDNPDQMNYDSYENFNYDLNFERNCKNDRTRYTYICSDTSFNSDLNRQHDDETDSDNNSNIEKDTERNYYRTSKIEEIIENDRV